MKQIYPLHSSSSEVQFKYIYFNHMNLAEKTTVHTDSKKSSNLAITQDLLLLLSDINSDISGWVATFNKTYI